MLIDQYSVGGWVAECIMKSEELLFKLTMNWEFKNEAAKDIWISGWYDDQM